MSDARFSRTGELFHRAVAYPAGAQRDDFVRQACGDDAPLCQELRRLLEAHEAAGDFLEVPAHAQAHALLGEQLLQSAVGRRMGVWRIERSIHGGGMGAVYLAQREGGDFQQQAAVKVIRAGILHPAALERFAQERQVLARLEHPYIARLLDGGTSEEGLPWLAMEYVPGEPIDQWADAHALGLHQRLVLFEKVCEAVQYAHRHLVIHRDIKPANILVTAGGEPRLLDFGIAKLLPAGGMQPGHTVTQHRVFTPGYASPEQFTGAPVTTASDVYSLGALLYRLLTGRLPFALETIPALEAERQVTQLMPPLPSEAVRAGETGLPRIGKLRASQLQRSLRGDLDTIVMTALRKEPERRFGSAAALADDLRRYRQSLPVQARPDTLGYRTRRFVNRHWKGVAAAGVSVLALLTGLGLALWQAEQARTDRDRVQRINTFLQDILIEADPYEAGADATVRDLLRTADSMIATRFADAPELEATLRATVGQAQLSLLDLDDAGRNLERADELHHSLHGDADARSIGSRLQLALLAFERGDVQTAESLYRETLARLAALQLVELRGTALNDLAIVLLYTDRSDEALELLQRSLQFTSGDEAPDSLANTYNNIGHAHHNLEQLEEAEQNYRRALELLRTVYPDDQHPDIASAANNLAILLHELGRPDEALALYEESLQIRRATLGPEHPRTGVGHLNLGRLLVNLDRLDEARPHLQSALQMARAVRGEDHLHTLVARSTLARIDFLQGRPAPAVRELSLVKTALERIQAPASRIEGVSDWLEEARAALR